MFLHCTTMSEHFILMKSITDLSTVINFTSEALPGLSVEAESNPLDYLRVPFIYGNFHVDFYSSYEHPRLLNTASNNISYLI